MLARRVAPETVASPGATSPKSRAASFSSKGDQSPRDSGDLSPNAKKRIAREKTSHIQAADRKRFHPRVVRRVHALKLAKTDLRVRMLLCFPLVHTCCKVVPVPLSWDACSRRGPVTLGNQLGGDMCFASFATFFVVF